MRWTLGIVLLLAVVLGGHKPSLAEPGNDRPTASDPGSTTETPWEQYLRTRPPPRVPEKSLEYAHDYYVGRYRRPNPEKGPEKLRFWVLTTEPDQFEPNRRHAVENGWDARFLRDLDEAIAWYRGLRAGDARKVYELGKAYQAEAPSETVRLTGDLLVGLAHDLGVPEAIVGKAHEALAREESWIRSAGQSFLRQAAFQGHPPALVEIVSRLREGRGFDRDDVEAYYWLLRSREAGLDVLGEVRAMETRLSRPQREKARGWLKLDSYPRRWERED